MDANAEDEQMKATECLIEEIYALRGVSGKDVEAALIEGISDPCPAIRRAAVEVLGETFDPKFEAIQRALLTDEDEGVREIAVRNLRLLEKGICIVARPSIEDCLEDLTATHSHIRERALQALGGVTDDLVVEKAVAILKGDSSQWCRFSAADFLEGVHTAEVVEAYFAVLGEESIGGYVAHRLAKRGDSGIDDYLFETLVHGEGVLRYNVACGVGSGSDIKTIPILSSLLTASDEKLAEAAGHSLSRLCARYREESGSSAQHGFLAPSMWDSLRPALMEASMAENIQIREVALDLLCHMHLEAAAPLVREALRTYVGRLASTSAADPQGYDREWDIIASAVRTLKLSESAEWLWPVLRTEDPQIRAEAAGLMHELGDERGRTELELLLKNQDFTVRAQAAMALLRQGDSGVWDVLADLLRKRLDDDWYLKRDILETLNKTDRVRAISLFIEILENPGVYELEDEEFGWIITRLGESGATGTVETLRKWRHRVLSNCDGDVVDEAIAAIQGAPSPRCAGGSVTAHS